MVRTRVPSPQGLLAAQYAEKWLPGSHPPDLVQFLDVNRTAPAEDLLEVLLLDQHLAWDWGRGRPVEWYQDRLPQLEGNDAWLLELISGECRHRARRGEAPSTQELKDRFPSLGPHLSKQLGLTVEPLDPTTRVPSEDGEIPDDPARNATLVAPRSDFQSDAGSTVGSTRPIIDPLHVIGRTIEDRYTITGYLGKGGFGAVYDARDRRFEKLNDDTSKVAIKLMTSFGVDFAREAHLIKLFKHPHVVEVYDFGVEGDRLAWLVMEFLPGLTLRDVMIRSAGPQPDHLIRKFVEECGPALQHAHSRNLVHRDLKPQNIMLVHAGQPGEYFKILDFGISTKGDAQDDLVNRTMAGAGTPEYMSPEQVRAGSGAGLGTTSLSDVYTFGVLLFELLTGRVPFPLTGFSPLAISKCYLDVINTPPPRFADVAPERWKPRKGNAGGGELELLVRQCLEKDPALRPKSMREVQTRFLEVFQTEKPPPRRSSVWIAPLLLAATALPPAAWWMLQPVPCAVDLLRNRLDVVAGQSAEFDLLHRSPECKGPLILEFAGLPEGVQFTPLPGEGQDSQRIQIRSDLNTPTQTAQCTVRVNSESDPKLTRDFAVQLVIQQPVVWLPEAGRFERSADPQSRIIQTGGRNYYSHLQRIVDGQRVTFLFVPQTATLQPFYIMEDKVSRGLFAAYLRQKSESDTVDADLARRLEMTTLPVPHEDWPATNLTVDEAHACANWLGGMLPTPEQWDAAAGRFDTPQSARGPFRGEWSEQGGLKIAIGVQEPWPIGKATDDVSPHGCRDMAGNGLEFTREAVFAAGGSRTVPLPAPRPSDTVTLRGRSFESIRPLFFTDLEENALPYGDASPTVGFRAALDIP